MAEEKTEAPTPKRLEEARRRGEVPRSRELSASLTLVAGVGAVAAAGSAAAARMLLYGRDVFATASADSTSSTQAIAMGVRVMAEASAPPLATATAVALLWGGLQTRGLVTLAPLTPDLGRLAPSWKRLVQGASPFEIGKSLLTLALLGAIAYLEGREVLHWLPGLVGAMPARVVAVASERSVSLAFRLAGATLLVGFADFLWQRHRHLASLRMSRDEIKREYKESEGDPHHKAERERLHRELVERRALEEVRKADFVVVNPDHLAVAVRYERDGERAPVVLARGERLHAERIKQIAREAGVPIFRDVGLARALWEVPEGEEIPDALFEAVAEILRVVYGMSLPGRPGEGAEPQVPAGTSSPSPAPQPGWRRA